MSAQPAHLNEVRLVGRLAAARATKELPSGDVLVTFRLVVDRDPARRRAAPAQAPTVDTLDCVTWKPDVARRIEAIPPGETVAVEGALRRRFWRTPAGPSSRSEVEVVRARRARK